MITEGTCQVKLINRGPSTRYCKVKFIYEEPCINHKQATILMLHHGRHYDQDPYRYGIQVSPVEKSVNFKIK